MGPTLRRTVFWAAVMILALSGCGPKSLQVVGAGARPAAAGENSAVYFTIDNPLKEAETLMSVVCDAAAQAEMHMSKTDNGVMRMEPWTDVEVAFALVPSAWGKGYAGEVAARSLRFAHEVVGARGVASHILVGNAAAIRVAERLGASYAGDADVQVNATPIRIYVYPDPG